MTGNCASIAAPIAASIAASIATPGPMELRLESRGRRDPLPPAQRNAAAPWQDWLFERVTMLFAILVLSMLLAIIGALGYAALPALQSSGRSRRSTERWSRRPSPC
jgi:hypothetical protein